MLLLAVDLADDACLLACLPATIFTKSRNSERVSERKMKNPLKELSCAALIT